MNNMKMFFIVKNWNTPFDSVVVFETEEKAQAFCEYLTLTLNNTGFVVEEAEFEPSDWYSYT